MIKFGDTKKIDTIQLLSIYIFALLKIKVIILIVKKLNALYKKQWTISFYQLLVLVNVFFIYITYVIAIQSIERFGFQYIQLFLFVVLTLKNVIKCTYGILMNIFHNCFIAPLSWWLKLTFCACKKYFSILTGQLFNEFPYFYFKMFLLLSTFLYISRSQRNFFKYTNNFLNTKKF